MGADGEESDNLTGVWHGRYFYKRGPAPVFFTASLIETGTARDRGDVRAFERRCDGIRDGAGKP